MTYVRPSLASDHQKKSGTSTFSPSAAAPLTTENFCAVAQECRIALRDANSSFVHTLYVIVFWAYQLAELLWDDDALWEKFQKDPFFARHARLDRRHCVRYALMYMYGSHRGRHAERARDHARALQPLWQKEASAREVFAALRKGGFQKLKSAKQKRTVTEGGDACVLRQSFEVKNDRIIGKLKRFKDGDELVAHLKVRENAHGSAIMMVTKVELKGRSDFNSTASQTLRRKAPSAQRAAPRDDGRGRRLLASGR